MFVQVEASWLPEANLATSSSSPESTAVSHDAKDKQASEALRLQPSAHSAPVKRSSSSSLRKRMLTALRGGSVRASETTAAPRGPPHTHRRLHHVPQSQIFHVRFSATGSARSQEGQPGLLELLGGQSAQARRSVHGGGGGSGGAQSALRGAHAAVRGGAATGGAAGRPVTQGAAQMRSVRVVPSAADVRGSNEAQSVLTGDSLEEDATGSSHVDEGTA